MAMAAIAKLNVADMRQRIAAVLDARRDSDAQAMYATCGAIHVRAALGLPQVDMPRIATWQRADGVFDDGQTSGSAHALCVALSAMNLTGEVIPDHVAPLAPVEVDALVPWLETLDWSTTHKDLWGAVTPVLASGLVDATWTRTLIDWLANKPWWNDGDAPWRVISTIYHIASALDAGCIAYPNADALLEKVLSLQWDRVDDGVNRTDCTDGDWAWMLLRLSEMRPGYHGDIMAAIRRVAQRRVAQWHDEPEAMLAKPTFFIWCVLWGTAVFQGVCRDHFEGGWVRDTLNAPALYRGARRSRGAS